MKSLVLTGGRMGIPKDKPRRKRSTMEGKTETYAGPQEEAPRFVDGVQDDAKDAVLEDPEEQEA